MLSSKLSLRGSYDIFTPGFTVAFDFLKRKDLATLPEGWIELEEGGKGFCAKIFHIRIR